MHLLVEIGYKKFILQQVTYEIAVEMIHAIPVDDVYTDGESSYVSTSDKVKVSIIRDDQLPTMTSEEWLVRVQQRIAERENGNQDSVE